MFFAEVLFRATAVNLEEEDRDAHIVVYQPGQLSYTGVTPARARLLARVRAARSSHGVTEVAAGNGVVLASGPPVGCGGGRAGLPDVSLFSGPRPWPAALRAEAGGLGNGTSDLAPPEYDGSDMDASESDGINVVNVVNAETQLAMHAGQVHTISPRG